MIRRRHHARVTGDRRTSQPPRLRGLMSQLFEIPVAADGSVFAVDIRGQRIQKFARAR